MILGFINKFNLMFIKLIEMLGGILIGIGQNLASLQNMGLANTMVGIAIVGNNLINNLKMPMALGHQTTVK